MRSYVKKRSVLRQEIPEPHPAQPPGAEPIEQQAGRVEDVVGCDGNERQHAEEREQ